MLGDSKNEDNFRKIKDRKQKCGAGGGKPETKNEKDFKAGRKGNKEVIKTAMGRKT